ncbi:hypothetical protein HDZ31DRAFT_37453, partial [Schizophyllum fasciatum]
VRKDISTMFCNGDFVLAPTFRGYKDVMQFMSVAGIKDANNGDGCRRPLTALSAPTGLYRYVFIARTDAAKALQVEFDLQPQTDDDLNHGIHPRSGKPCREGSDRFPVVQCYAHPYSVSNFAYKMLWRHSTTLSAQWHTLVSHIVDQWELQRIVPPRWFVEDKFTFSDDITLDTTEATGYDPLLAPQNPVASRSVTALGGCHIPLDSYRQKVTAWVLDVDADEPPPEEKPPRIAYKLRRSERLRAKACPYSRSSPSRSGPPPSPTRNGPRTILACRRDLICRPPAWVERNGDFPTHRFSSNDWAYFFHNVSLAYAPQKRTYGVRTELTRRSQLASPSGTYRYVFIAYTEAARALQVELKLRPPTKEDMNGGIYPLDNKPCLAGSDQFPVVECCTHPYSISTLADRTFCKRSTLLTAQWHALVGHILYQRVNQALNPPRWFVDAPKCGDDDVELTPSEASGYQLSSGGKYPVPEPGALLSNADVSATDFRIAIADWVCNKKDPKAAPPKEHPILTTYKTRRSERLRAKARPCDRPPTPDRPPPSPTRNVPRALATCRRDLTRSPPAWAGHNGNFPTGRFSSNDWAYFCYNVNLAYTPSMDT